MKNNSNIKAVISGDGGVVPIPVNCTYKTGSNNEGSENFGVVIKDSKNNEWVWVPVPDATVLDNNGNIIKNADSTLKLKTGVTDYTKANNLYDIAGNCSDFSMEATNSYSRCTNGFNASYFGSSYPASKRGRDQPASGNDKSLKTSRSTLLINPN